MQMYEAVLVLHSYLRWLVLALLIAVSVRSYLALRAGRGWLDSDDRLHSALIQAFDTQMLLGLVLYLFLSPWSQVFLADTRHGLKDSTLRFFGLEHIAMMLMALVVIHVARVRSKRASTPLLRHRRVLRGTLLALVLVLVAVPWPGLPYGRPLFRGSDALETEAAS